MDKVHVIMCSESTHTNYPIAVCLTERDKEDYLANPPASIEKWMTLSIIELPIFYKSD